MAEAPILTFDPNNLNIPLGEKTKISVIVCPGEKGDITVTLSLPKNSPLVFMDGDDPLKVIDTICEIPPDGDVDGDFNFDIEVVIKAYDNGNYAKLIPGFAKNSADLDSEVKNLVVRIFNPDDGNDPT